jgi:Acyl-CoA carboxylase epsilon subunit
VRDRSVLRVVSGDATPEEIAAVVAAVAAATSSIAMSSTATFSTAMSSTAMSSTATSSSDGTAIADGGSARPAETSLWSAPGYAHRSVGAMFAPGPDSWRTSFWPR